MINWERRKKNIRILLAQKDMSATEFARRLDLSPNTLTKFLNSRNDRALSAKTLKRIVLYFKLTDEADLDTDDPLADPRIEIRKMLEDLNDGQAYELKEHIKKRYFPSATS